MNKKPDSLRVTIPVVRGRLLQTLLFSAGITLACRAADSGPATPSTATSPTPTATTAGAPATTPAATPATPAQPGKKVGEKAPDFTLKNADGKEVALRDLLKQGKVALMFYRSGDWCPFCIAQLQELQQNLKDVQAAGVQLVGISYDSEDTLKRVREKLKLAFPLLSDPGSKTIDAYGIRNESATGRATGVPHPVIYILDQEGVIRVKLMREGYRDRPKPEEIIAAVKSIK